MSVPLAITIASLILGLVLMVLWWLRSPAFFRGRPETFHDETRSCRLSRRPLP